MVALCVVLCCGVRMRREGKVLAGLDYLFVLGAVVVVVMLCLLLVMVELW